MRTHRYFTAGLALLCSACVTTRAVAPYDVRFADRISLVSDSPLMLRGTFVADRSLKWNCPLTAVAGLVAGIGGDSIWIAPITTRRFTGDAAGECASVDEGVIALGETVGVRITRQEISGARVALVVLGLIVALGIALDSGFGFTLASDR